MDSTEVKYASLHNEDTDDEDTEYFLQATVGAYDLKEKIKTANDDLFEDYYTYTNVVREPKVTFLEELVDYEPDFTSDDGSIQSPDVFTNSEQEYNDISVNNSDSELSTEESNYMNDSKIVEIENYPKENLENNTDELTGQSERNNSSDDCKSEEINIIDETMIVVQEYIVEDEETIEVIEIIQDDIDEIDNNNETVYELEKSSNEETVENKSTRRLKKSPKTETINCRIHCLEKKELDIICGVYKNNTDSGKGPVLKLRQRSCCANQDKLKLPIYNGLISEYGLSKTQQEMRQKRNVKLAQIKKEKLLRLNEEKRQKDMYNEEIFCAWLKSLRERNQSNRNNKENRKSEFSTPPIKQRPKTATYSKTTWQTGKKRPYTSPCKGVSYTTIFLDFTRNA